MSIEGLIVFVLLVMLVAGLAAMSVRIVPEYQRLVVFRLGRVTGARGPGLVLLIPVNVQRGREAALQADAQV